MSGTGWISDWQDGGHQISIRKLLWLIDEEKPNRRRDTEEGSLQRRCEQEIWEELKKRGRE